VNEDRKFFILLDTEGLGDVENNMDRDIHLFTLSILLCSFFIFNTMGVIDAEKIKQLRLVAELSNHIKVKSKPQDDGNDIDQVLPPFCWLLRDFFLKLEQADGTPKTPDEYLEDCLSVQPGQSSSVQQENNVKSAIRAYFTERKCFVFETPVGDKEKLQDLENYPQSNLNPGFNQSVANFLDYLSEHVPPKKLFGRELNGRLFIGLVQQYLDAINDKKIPNVEDSWTSLYRTECEKAREDALRLYNEKMEFEMPVENDKLENFHFQAYESAVTFLLAHCIGDPKAYQEELHKSICGDQNQNSPLCLYEEKKKQNEKASIRKCSEILKKFYNPILQKLPQYRSFGDYEQDQAEVKRKFQATQGKGPKSAEVLESFFQEKTIESQTLMKNLHTMTEKDKELAREREKARQAELKAEAERQRLAQTLENKNREYQIQMEATQSRYLAEIARNQQESQQIQTRREAELKRMIDAGFETEKAAWDKQTKGTLANLQRENEELRRKMEEIKRKEPGICTIS
jgi:hypothetical protein